MATLAVVCLICAIVAVTVSTAVAWLYLLDRPITKSVDDLSRWMKDEIGKDPTLAKECDSWPGDSDQTRGQAEPAHQFQTTAL